MRAVRWLGWLACVTWRRPGAGCVLWERFTLRAVLGVSGAHKDHRDMSNKTPLPTAMHADEPARPTDRPYRERLLRVADVGFLTGLGRSTIYARVQAGAFPVPVQMGRHSVAWRESEVDAWIAARPLAHVAAPKKGGRARSVRADA